MRNPLDVHVHVHLHNDPDPRIDQILAAVTTLTNQGVTVMADLTALTAEVENNTTVEASALALIQGFAAQLAAAGTDPAALQALTDTLTANDAALAAAVAANTPAAPTV